jgi:hypothetical protein
MIIPQTGADECFKGTRMIVTQQVPMHVFAQRY